MNRPASIICLVAAGLPLLSAGAAQNSAADSELLEIIGAAQDIRSADHTLPVPEGIDERYSDRLDTVSIERFKGELAALEDVAARLDRLDSSGVPRRELVIPALREWIEEPAEEQAEAAAAPA